MTSILFIPLILIFSFPAEISCITLNPQTVTLKTGETIQAQAAAYDESGNVIPNAIIQYLPTPEQEHCVTISESGLLTGKTAGQCGVGALSVTTAGKVITHQNPISITVADPVPEPSPTPEPCGIRLPNGKCKKGCICL